MNLDRYTQKSQEAILESKSLAQELHHQSIEPAHLLMALLKQEDGVVPAIVNKLAGSVLGLREEVHQELENRSKVYDASGEIGLSGGQLMSLLQPNVMPRGCRMNMSPRNTSCSVSPRAVRASG